MCDQGQGLMSMSWKSMEAIPDDRMDGRDILLWFGTAVICSWCDGWRDPVGREVVGATLWADILEPEGVTR